MAENNKSAAFYLFHSWIGWRVPEYAMVTEYATQTQGLYLPANEKQQKARLLAKTTTFQHPSDIAVYVQSGMALDVNDPSDGIIVYGWIMEHLADWLDYLDSPMLLKRPVPIQGLREFNALANLLFPVANRYGYFKKPEVTMTMTLQSLFTGAPVESMQIRHRFNDKIMRAIETKHRMAGGR